MARLVVRAASAPLRGTVVVPADKSISHRAILLSALTEGEMRLENVLESVTVQATIDCVRALGVEIETRGDALIVHGRGLDGLSEPGEVLFCRGSGTTMRLLAGICAGQPFLSIIDGTAALRRRPMARVIDPLRAMGASIGGQERDGYAPLRIAGRRPLLALEHRLTVASAQVKSAILLAALFTQGTTIVHEPAPSRDHTERMLAGWGAEIDRPTPNTVRLTPPPALEPAVRRLSIPNDISSAAFFIVAALLLPGSEITLPGIGLNPTRTGLLDVLAEMGARLETENLREENGEQVGDLVVRAAPGLHGAQVAGDLIPRMIDEFPILAVAATQAEGETLVRDAGELHYKESDRIETLVEELRKMGATIEARADGFCIHGPTCLRGGSVNAHGDHRLAMSLAIAGLLAEGETVIEGWDCVADSFPGFERELARVSG